MNVYVVGFGKAVSGMARTLEDHIGQHIVRGIISIPHGSQELFHAHGKEYVFHMLTLKAPITTAADGKFETSFLIFEKNKL